MPSIRLREIIIEVDDIDTLCDDEWVYVQLPHPVGGTEPAFDREELRQACQSALAEIVQKSMEACLREFSEEILVGVIQELVEEDSMMQRAIRIKNDCSHF